MSFGFGLLGEKLSHSYSPMIHNALGAYDYGLYEVTPEALEDFMKNGTFSGLNVTSPYKKEVCKYVELDPIAIKLGNVNTVYHKDGILRGTNTDYFGFQCLVEELGVEIAGKKVLVLGASGGAGTTASMVLGDLGAIDPRFDVAVSTACGALDDLVVETAADAQRCVEFFPSDKN